MSVAGRVMPLPKGSWDADTEYTVLDIVGHQGSSFIAKRTSIGVEPVDGAYWQKLVGIQLDTELSETSENGVQNKVVAEAISQLNDDLSETASNVSDIDAKFNGTISDAYDSEKTYTVGEYCIDNNQMWKCKVQCQGQKPSENAYWTARKIGDEIKRINDCLSGKFATTQYTYSDTTVPYPSGFTLDNCCVINKYVLYAQKLYYNAINIDEYRANGVAVSRAFPNEQAFANAPSFLVFMKYQ